MYFVSYYWKNYTKSFWLNTVIQCCKCFSLLCKFWLHRSFEWHRYRTRLTFVVLLCFCFFAEEKRDCLDNIDCKTGNHMLLQQLSNSFVKSTIADVSVFITVSSSVFLHYCYDASNQASCAINWNWIFTLKVSMIKRILSAPLYYIYWAALHFHMQIKTISIEINVFVLWYIFSSIKLIVQQRQQRPKVIHLGKMLE